MNHQGEIFFTMLIFLGLGHIIRWGGTDAQDFASWAFHLLAVACGVALLFKVAIP